MSETRKDVAPSSGSSIEKALFQEKLRFLDGVRADDVIVVDRATPTADVLGRMRERRDAGTLVSERGDPRRLAGIFTARDYLVKIATTGAPVDVAIETYMTPEPRTLTPDNTVGDAIQVMTVGGYRHVPLLTDEGTVFGLVSVRDIVNFIADHFPEEVYNLPPMVNQKPHTQEGG